ncbi:CynX/NimT family MFS transporter [Sphingobacterium paucimobilis]|uniref:Major facilitator superfamily (MFS) profile domain-containing protein n=1 Tax=Sphingobacterium paucimobilis HER1398 TaxID=1346330 RepID=U2HS86_9SPHI|nr:MFS transporter [Sphingobacterium paucimobilis]ERJ58135.1 hypothetical protein M472_05090 [Sphingobacterium paucimobilis HER1398]
MKHNIGLLSLSIAVIILIGGGLRAPITAVSPVLTEIIAALQLNNIEGSLLTSIPLIVFASCSVLVSKIAVRFNIHYSLIFSLILLLAGLYVRVYGNMATLFIGSFLIGLGICIGNVTTPAYIKTFFPDRIGVMTGIFSVGMNFIAALASGLSIGIGEWSEMGWRGSLGIWMFWVLLALLAVVIEAFLGSKNKTEKVHVVRESPQNFNVFRSRQAWYISIFMGIQSLVYYCLVALLPVVLIDYGMAKEQTGIVLLIIQLAMLPVLFISPIIATRLKDQKWMIYGVGVLMFGGITMLMLLKSQFVYTAAVMIGISSGLAFSLSILFFSLKSKTMEGTIKISGKAQSVGYLIAAFGPPIFGLLHDWDVSWQSSFYFLLLMIIIMVFFGREAAKPRFIEEH